LTGRDGCSYKDLIRRRMAQCLPGPKPTAIISTVDFRHLEHILRSLDSVSTLEVEDFDALLKKADLTNYELHMLETIAQALAKTSERNNGWHCGFGDLVRRIKMRQREKEAA
jgi:hypothetical protein